ncbi:MAG: DUF6576 domain-containing protein [Crocinitomicaceae bacterium]
MHVLKLAKDYNFEAKQRQEKIDKILDKISKSGYESLTKREKDFLFLDKVINNGWQISLVEACHSFFLTTLG